MPSDYGLALRGFAAAAALAAALMPAGCSKTGSRIESLKGWTLPQGKEVPNMKLKHSWMKPVSDVVECQESAVEPLLKQLAAVQPSEACGYMVALAYLHDQRAVDPILDILRKEEGAAGQYAAFALSKLEKQGSVKKLADMAGDAAGLAPAVRTNYFRALAWSRSPDSVPALVKGVSDPDEGVRNSVLEELAVIKNASLVAPLIAAVKAGPPASSSLAAKALAFNRELLVERDILAMASDESDFVRMAVVELLGAIDSPAGFKVVVAALDDKAPSVRQASAAVLGSLKAKKVGKEEIVKVAQIMDCEDEAAAKAAYETLVKLGALDAREVLVRLLDSQKPHAKRFASSLLIQCAPFREVSDKTDLRQVPEIPKLIELLASDDKDTVLNAGNTLRLYTGKTFDDDKKLWDQWWANHQALMQYVGEALKLIAIVKKWRDEETIIDHKQDALANLEKAGDLLDQAEKDGLTQMSFDNEHLEINRLLRIVQSTGGIGD